MDKKYIRFYPTKVLIKWWKNGDISIDELKSLVRKEYLPKELNEYNNTNR